MSMSVMPVLALAASAGLPPRATMSADRAWISFSFSQVKALHAFTTNTLPPIGSFSWGFSSTSRRSSNTPGHAPAGFAIGFFLPWPPRVQDTVLSAVVLPPSSPHWT